jgi:hypothetical protein
MLRTLAVAIALVAFAGAAAADCGGDHSAKETLTPDHQANASRVPATSKNGVHATSKTTDMKNGTKPVDKASSDKLAANKKID